MTDEQGCEQCEAAACAYDTDAAAAACAACRPSKTTAQTSELAGIETLRFVDVAEHIAILRREIDEGNANNDKILKRLSAANEEIGKSREEAHDLRGMVALQERYKLDALKALAALEAKEKQVDVELVQVRVRAAWLEKELAESRAQVFGLMSLKVEVDARVVRLEEELAYERQLSNDRLEVIRELEGRSEDALDRKVEEKVNGELLRVRERAELLGKELAEAKEEIRKRQAEMVELRADLSHADLEARELAVAHAWHFPRTGTPMTALDILGHDRDVWKERAEQAALQASENHKEAERLSEALETLRTEYAEACFAGTARRPLKRCKHPAVRFGSNGWLVFCPDCSASWQAQQGVEEACQSSPETEGDRYSERVRRGAP